MPYEKLTDLPDSVRDNLPKHAQEIYRAAYNSAEEQGGSPSPGGLGRRRAKVREERRRRVGREGGLKPSFL